MSAASAQRSRASSRVTRSATMPVCFSPAGVSASARSSPRAIASVSAGSRLARRAVGERAHHVRAVAGRQLRVRTEEGVRDEVREAIERLLQLRRRCLALAAAPETEREIVAARHVPRLKAERALQRLVAVRTGAED